MEARGGLRSRQSPGFLRITGFVSKPELQKLNRNSIYVFVNQRLGARPAGAACADGGVPEHHSADVVSGGAAVSGDAAAGGGCECASGEDRGALSAGEFVHDFIRDSVRTALMTARPAASFCGGAEAARDGAACVAADGCESDARALNSVCFRARTGGGRARGVIDPGDAAVYVAGAGWWRSRRGGWRLRSGRSRWDTG